MYVRCSDWLRCFTTVNAVQQHSQFVVVVRVDLYGETPTCTPGASAKRVDSLALANSELQACLTPNLFCLYWPDAQ